MWSAKYGSGLSNADMTATARSLNVRSMRILELNAQYMDACVSPRRIKDTGSSRPSLPTATPSCERTREHKFQRSDNSIAA